MNLCAISHINWLNQMSRTRQKPRVSAKRKHDLKARIIGFLPCPRTSRTTQNRVRTKWFNLALVLNLPCLLLARSFHFHVSVDCPQGGDCCQGVVVALVHVHHGTCGWCFKLLGRLIITHWLILISYPGVFRKWPNWVINLSGVLNIIQKTRKKSKLNV
jgi:hypothetical protein